MLIRLSHTTFTSTNFATHFVEGGLLFYRPGLTTDRVVGVTTYKRSLPERPYRRRPMFRRRKPHRGARRTLGFGRPPRLTYEDTTWKIMLGLEKLPGPERNVEVARPRRRRFVKWAARVVRLPRRYRARLPWGHHPHQQQEPVITLWGWYHRGGPSPLRGRYPPATRDIQLHYRLRGLLRRARHYRELRRLAAAGKEYVRYYYHRRRRKLGLCDKRHHLFRRRRLRGHHRTRPTIRGYLRGTTRVGFHRGCGYRRVRLEQAAALGDVTQQYYTGSARWNTHTWGRRVGTPWEYNYYRPLRGYHRFEKKRRPDARRWKLGQHHTWGVNFHEARQLRWDWFATTVVAAAKVPQLAAPPLTCGLVSSLYWSSQPWGRGRWGRPSRRAAHIFVASLKTGHTVEVDATQWGAAATAATGVLHSHALENELTGEPTPAVLPEIVIPTVELLPVTGELTTLLWVMTAVTTSWLWWCITPVWWVWRATAVGWCFLLETFWFVFCWAYAVATAVSTGVNTFFMVQLTYPVTRWVTHWVKERPLIKTAAWLWTSWLLTYNADDEQAELDNFYYFDNGNNLLNDEEIDPDFESYEYLDEYEPGVVDHGAHQWWDNRWFYDVTSFFQDWLEVLQDWVTEEFPHRAGLFCRPFVDVAVRLPVWAIAEGVTTFTLWCKLEWQHRWYTLLTRGNTTHKVVGRWWKVPLILIALLCRIVTTGVVGWFIFSQVDYSAFRVGLTYSWGVPWREEYYAAWFFVSGLTAVYLVGPTSWKTYLFEELGIDHLMGTYLVGAELGSEESYYPSRPPGVIERTATQAIPWRHKSHLTELSSDSSGWWDSPHVSGYDKVRLRLAQHYGWQDYGYDYTADVEDLYALFPVHQTMYHRNRTWYPLQRENSYTTRAARDTFGVRTNRYQHFDENPTAKRFIPWRVPHHSRQHRITFLPDETP